MLRRTSRAVGICLLGIFVIASLNGAARKPKKPKASWFNARGVVTFPLGAGAFPSTADEMAFSLSQGWARTPLTVALGRGAFSAVGAPPEMDVLTIDLSGSSLDPKRKSTPIARDAPVERTMRVAQLRLLGESIRVADEATMSVGVTAEGARLDLRRDKQGNPNLMLGDARSGELTFSTTPRDIEAIILAAAKADAGKVGLNVQSVKLTLVSEDDRTLRGELRVGTKFAFIGAGLKFTARVAIDDDMNARLTNLTCNGDDVLGPIVVGLIRPGLQKYNNRERPIMSFSGSTMKLRDVRVTVDETVRVRAVFGGS